jgi:SAM-dependent methyltransferase
MTPPQPTTPRSTAFGAAATAYGRYRPEPAPEALDWILRPNDRDVVDVGAGTGQLTAPLLARGLSVTAVEPDPEMRRALARRAAAAAILDGAAERLPLGDRSQDAVLSHAAAHWFDPRGSVLEAARVLRPGGVLGALQTSFEPEVKWLAELWDLLEPDPRDRRPGGRAGRIRGVAARLRAFGPLAASFEDREEYVARFSRRMTPDEIVGWAGTYSGLLALPPEERAVRLADLRRLIERRFPGSDTVVVPLRTRCWRAERRA